jgi:hypothetical protein
MRYPTAFSAAALLAVVTFLAPASLTAKNTEWKDLSGAHFKGEPVEVLGPFALFKTSLTTGRRVLLRGLAPADILRLHEIIAERPARAATWADAKGAATRDVVGNAMVVKNKELVPADLTQEPEPELLLVLYGSHNDGESWSMAQKMTAVYQRARRVYPGKLGCVFIGVRHSAIEHRRIAITTYMPWLVADFDSQPSMSLLSRFAPSEGTLMILLSRDGVPLVSARASDLTEMKKFADGLSTILASMDPSNPRAWKDRSHYLDLTRPVDFAQSSTGPLLIGDPLRADGLRQRGISHIKARLDIADDGHVSAVSLLPASDVPDDLKTPLADALRKQAVFSPAIGHGKPVAGTFDYAFNVPPENKPLAADTAWLNGEARNDLPLPSWLLLQPIKVEETAFSESVDHVAADDTLVMKPLQVSGAKVSRDAQMNAFKTDWFAKEGAGSVHPVEGDAESINGTVLTWKRVASKDGLVEFPSDDYSVGYAWTEFESPVEADAWLGFGSDDGVRIWHNNELVCDQWIRRMSVLDDNVVPLHLKKGVNRLLIKIQNATGEWSFICRLRTR